jgi:hypothetical protein
MTVARSCEDPSGDPRSRGQRPASLKNNRSVASPLSATIRHSQIVSAKGAVLGARM